MKTNELKTALEVCDSIIAGEVPDFEKVLEVRVAVRRSIDHLTRQSKQCAKISNRPKKEKGKKAKKRKAEATA